MLVAQSLNSDSATAFTSCMVELDERDGDGDGKNVSARTMLRRSSKNRKDLLQKTTFIRFCMGDVESWRSITNVGLLSCSISSNIPISCRSCGAEEMVSESPDSSLSASRLAFGPLICYRCSRIE